MSEAPNYVGGNSHAIIFVKVNSGLTKRAPDKWDAPRLMSIIQSFGLFCLRDFSYALPHASNANRWADTPLGKVMQWR